MSTYYVRKSGNDGNDGESAAQAWLTWQHAADNVGAADVVRIGAGVYRETVTLATSGSAGYFAAQAAPARSPASARRGRSNRPRCSAEAKATQQAVIISSSSGST